MPGWFNRPVVAVADMDRALDFYIRQFCFRENWRHEDGDVRIVEVDREGCQLILSNQWPERAGAARHFVSLDPPDFVALQAEIADGKVEAREGRWGYRLIVVADPDGNELWFPHPDENVGEST